MDHHRLLEQAVGYLETHLTEDIDCAAVAKQCYVSSYHFQRIFSLLCGMPLGEYIRKRRLTLAGLELAASQCKVIDAAVKYGYESPDSFTRAFIRFHGISPSEARLPDAKLRALPRLSISSAKGEHTMNCRIQHHPGMILTGFGQRFTGVPYGSEREKQEEELYSTTRGKQWILRGASIGKPDANTDTRYYGVIRHVTEEGYDFHICFHLHPWNREHLRDVSVTGTPEIADMGFEEVVIPAGLYAVFSTENTDYPMMPYHRLRLALGAQWLPEDGYQLADRPEMQIIHTDHAEIWLPIEPI